MKYNKLAILFFCLLIIFSSSGCALYSAKKVKTPFFNQNWQITYKEKELYLTKTKFEKDLFNKVHTSDKYERAYLLNLSKKAGFYFDLTNNKTIKFGHINSCNESKSIMLTYVSKILSSHSPFSYIPKNNTACGWNDFPPFCEPTSKFTVTKNELNGFTLQYDLPISWFSNGRKAYGISGEADLSCNIKYISCEDQEIVAQLIVPDMKIKNTKTLFRQDIAEIIVEWDKFKAYLDKAFSTNFIIDGRLKYEYKLNSLVSDFERKRANRFTIYPQKKFRMNERKYKIDNKIVISRFQREFTDYKYDETNSMFIFTDIVRPIKSKYQQIESQYSLAIKVYPEANSTSVIVYEISYKPIIDSFSGKTVFGEKEIKKILHNKLIKNIESVIM